MTCEHCKAVHDAIENFLIAEWRLYYTPGVAGTSSHFKLGVEFPQLACPNCGQDLTFSDGPVEDDEVEAKRIEQTGYDLARGKKDG
jgi:copper chaperone CopZ